MSEANDRVIFLYLRNPEDPAHVATLARFKQGNVLTFAWAVNKVTRTFKSKHTGREQYTYASRTVHDVFNKARGREIAEGRLASEKSSITIELHEGERPLKAMLETLARNSEVNELRIPRFLSSWAAEALKGLYIDEQVNSMADLRTLVDKMVDGTEV